MIFNKTNFRIHSLCPGEERYYLNGIHATPDYTEVTNGHYLIRVDAPYRGTRKEALKDLPTTDGYKPVEKECKFIIPADIAKQIEQNIPKEKYLPQLNNAWLVSDKEEKATFLTTNLQTTNPVTFRKIEGKFANSDKIISNLPEKAPVTIGFNADYMIKICQQYKKANIKQVSLSLYGLEKAMKLEGIDTQHNQTITTLLMPVKMGETIDTWDVKQGDKKSKKH